MPAQKSGVPKTFRRAAGMRCSASKRAAVTAAWLRRETSDYYHGLLAWC
jgi:hypothetical protein